MDNKEIHQSIGFHHIHNILEFKKRHLLQTAFIFKVTNVQQLRDLLKVICSCSVRAFESESRIFPSTESRIFPSLFNECFLCL